MDRLTKYSEECRALADECGGLDRLRELAEADRDGRLVVLPAKTVFELTWDAGPDCDLICPVSVDGEGCCSFCDKGELCIYERKCQQEHIEQIGKTVFLTSEEAEAALEAKRDGSTSMYGLPGSSGGLPRSGSLLQVGGISGGQSRGAEQPPIAAGARRYEGIYHGPSDAVSA